MDVAAAGLLATALLWAGMILGVSVLATLAKFQAPSLALPVALDVGRHTFGLFNWVEIGWSLALVAFALFHGPRRRHGLGLWLSGLVAIACAVVAVETAWLLPALDIRVEAIIAGRTPPESNLHIFYIVLEGVKLVALLALAFGVLRRSVNAGGKRLSSRRHIGSELHAGPPGDGADHG